MTWVVVRTQPAAEKRAAKFIGLNQLECYLPRVRLNGCTRSLFGPYLFVRVIDAYYGWINRVAYVSYVLPSCSHQSDKIETLVMALRRRERDGVVQLPRPDRFARGQRVRLLAGPFSGQIGLFEGASRRECARVLLQVLGQTTVETKLRLLEAA